MITIGRKKRAYNPDQLRYLLRFNGWVNDVNRFVDYLPETRHYSDISLFKRHFRDWRRAQQNIDKTKLQSVW